MRFYECKDFFGYDWAQVMRAFWQRYPNPNSGHVLSEDVVCRRIEGDKLYTKRFITKTNRVPKLGEYIVGQRIMRDVGVIEESILDLRTKTLTTYTRNIGMRHVMSVEERCEYRPSTSDPRGTELVRHAWISSSLTGVSRAVTAFGVERFKQNCQKASAGFRFILHSMFPEVQPVVITHTPSGHLEGLKDTARKLARNRPNASPGFVLAAGGGNTSS